MNLFDQISGDIKSAMLAKDKVKLEALRNAKKCFLEAKTAPGAGDTLTDEAALGILQKLIKQGRESARIYTEQNRPDLADGELSQVHALEVYLPKQLSADELEAEVKRFIAEAGATSIKDMGRVMRLATAGLAGRAEGGAISAAVKKLLSA